ncbi:hypothetical protein OG345_41685 (plasmid) [Streptomyces sp. NBC_01220]|uniref:hypothetical protein n=1 Tax=Streptomyces sp. NBC_01220 TaxID=2903781 RepID=UPI00352CC4F7|nr:hypothetical protein OG345_41685 [Streptomyces sp. NBC_01220]
MRATEQTWANLPAFIDFSGGYSLWDVERLVRLTGSERAGSQIIKGIEQLLAENNIGHLPAKLPTDSTCRVLLYNRDQPNLGYILRLVHELATQDVDEDTNAHVHQLNLLLGGYVRPTAASEAAARHAAPHADAS